MRNIIKWIPAALALVLMLGSAGCTTVVYDMGEGYTDRDASLERDVINRLREDDLTGKYLFGVSAEGATVTLRGSVPNEMVRSRAIGIAYGAAGVQNVIDQLRNW
ncbi:MAG: BON domain-containing protein [Kiritimatiellae bacterium]|nr:BON domain-containing protein [Kiritimatiellia bacterium]